MQVQQPAGSLDGFSVLMGALTFAVVLVVVLILMLHYILVLFLKIPTRIAASLSSAVVVLGLGVLVDPSMGLAPVLACFVTGGVVWIWLMKGWSVFRSDD
jgi:hypothetical protein